MPKKKTQQDEYEILLDKKVQDLSWYSFRTLCRLYMDMETELDSTQKALQSSEEEYNKLLIKDEEKY